MPDFNPFLQPLAEGDGANKGDAGSIETYDQPTLIRWQTRYALPSDYEDALGDALEALFTQEVYALDAIVDGLNASGPRDPDGQSWTQASFKAVMKRLGDGGDAGNGSSG
jgi:hypothetical protein